MLATLGGMLGGSSCDRPPPALAPRPAPESRVEPPPTPRPVPPELTTLEAEIRALQQAKSFTAATQRYPRFLDELGKVWGVDSPDLAPYLYDFGLALRLAGREGEALAVAARGLARWPGDLRLAVLEATLRVKAAVEAGAFDPRTHELFQSILAPGNHPRLRGLRVDIASLHSHWAEMLFRAQRHGEARIAVEAALAIDPSSRHAREIQGRLHVVNQQPAAAVAVLEPLVAERPEPTLELCLGMALLDLGKPAEALARLAPLAGKPPGSSLSAHAAESYRDSLHSRTARALNELGRHAEAGRLLLEAPRLEAEPPDLLQELARAARGLGAERGASAIDLRLRRLLKRRRLLELASQARSAGFPASVPYYQAQAALESHRTGEAAALLERAIALGPTIALAHVERALVDVRLGLHARAERSLGDASRAHPSRLLNAARARAVLLSGDAAAARRLLEQAAPAAAPRPAAAAPTGPARLDEAPLVPVLEGLAWLELGEPARAGGNGTEGGLALLRAERLVLDGRLVEASGSLTGSFPDVPGGAEWAAALERLIAARAQDAAAAALDPSDWLDHPRLFLDPAHGCPQPIAAPLGQLHARRTELLAGIDGAPGEIALSRWHELVRLYVAAGAARKAREVAWHLAAQRPNGFEEQYALARVLSLDEEVVPRLAALREAARLRPRDPDVLQELSAAHALLGIQP